MKTKKVKKLLKGKIIKRLLSKKILLFLLSLILIFPSVMPLLRQDFFRMHDFTHVARLQQLDKAIRDGHVPPQWAKDLGWGYGMPLFHFYAPLPYLVAEVFYLLGFGFVNAIKAVFIFTFVLGFWGMFFLAGKFWNKWGAFFASLAFIYSPYRAVDFYVRGALGELFSIALIPWVLWAVTEVVDKKKARPIGLGGLMLGFFLLSHTILDLICLPLFVLFAAFYFLISQPEKASLFRLIKTFALGLGLAAFFLLPAFLEKGFTKVAELTGGYSHYSHHFLYFRQFWQGVWGYGGSIDGPNDGMSFHLGKVHLLFVGLCLGGWCFWVIFQKMNKAVPTILFFIFLGLILAFLSTYNAKFIWDRVPLMAYIQFPWRLNSFIIVCVSFLTGGIFYFLKKYKILIIPLFILGIFLLLKVNLRYFKPEVYYPVEDFYYSEEEKIKKQMSGVIPDYIPKWVEKEPKEISTEVYKILQGNPKIEVKKDKTQKTILKISSQDDFKLQLNRFYFPGWKLYQNGKRIDFTYENNNGIINLELPRGDYRLSLVLKNTWIRSMANLISGLSLLLIIRVFVKNEVSKQNKSTS